MGGGWCEEVNITCIPPFDNEMGDMLPQRFSVSETFYAGQSATRSAIGGQAPRKNPIADWSLIYIRFSLDVART